MSFFNLNSSSWDISKETNCTIAILTYIHCKCSYELGIPVGHHFLGPAKAIDWLKNRNSRKKA